MEKDGTTSSLLDEGIAGLSALPAVVYSQNLLLALEKGQCSCLT